MSRGKNSHPHATYVCTTAKPRAQDSQKQSESSWSEILDSTVLRVALFSTVATVLLTAGTVRTLGGDVIVAIGFVARVGLSVMYAGYRLLFATTNLHTYIVSAPEQASELLSLHLLLLSVVALQLNLPIFKPLYLPALMYSRYIVLRNLKALLTNRGLVSMMCIISFLVWSEAEAISFGLTPPWSASISISVQQVLMALRWALLIWIVVILYLYRSWSSHVEAEERASNMSSKSKTAQSKEVSRKPRFSAALALSLTLLFVVEGSQYPIGTSLLSGSTYVDGFNELRNNFVDQVWWHDAASKTPSNMPPKISPMDEARHSWATLSDMSDVSQVYLKNGTTPFDHQKYALKDHFDMSSFTSEITDVAEPRLQRLGLSRADTTRLLQLHEILRSADAGTLVQVKRGKLVSVSGNSHENISPLFTNGKLSVRANEALHTIASRLAWSLDDLQHIRSLILFVDRLRVDQYLHRAFFDAEFVKSTDAAYASPTANPHDQESPPPANAPAASAIPLFASSAASLFDATPFPDVEKTGAEISGLHVKSARSITPQSSRANVITDSSTDSASHQPLWLLSLANNGLHMVNTSFRYVLSSYKTFGVGVLCMVVTVTYYLDALPRTKSPKNESCQAKPKTKKSNRKRTRARTGSSSSKAVPTRSNLLSATNNQGDNSNNELPHDHESPGAPQQAQSDTSSTLPHENDQSRTVRSYSSVANPDGLSKPTTTRRRRKRRVRVANETEDCSNMTQPDKIESSEPQVTSHTDPTDLDVILRETYSWQAATTHEPEDMPLISAPGSSETSDSFGQGAIVLNSESLAPGDVSNISHARKDNDIDHFDKGASNSFSESTTNADVFSFNPNISSGSSTLDQAISSLATVGLGIDFAPTYDSESESTDFVTADQHGLPATTGHRRQRTPLNLFDGFTNVHGILPSALGLDSFSLSLDELSSGARPLAATASVR